MTEAFEINRDMLDNWWWLYNIEGIIHIPSFNMEVDLWEKMNLTIKKM
jgi:hypothetical protein